MRWMAILLAVSVLTGCYANPKIPPGWQMQPGEALLDNQARDDEGRLQVIAHFEWLTPSHAAMRLTAPGKPPVMWDPGGGYKEEDPAYNRQNDVIVDRTINLREWWHYREVGCQETYNLVFEWDLSPQDAAAMYEALLAGRVFRGDLSAFQTDRFGFGCCKGVCDFLQRYAMDYVTVPKRYFWPSDLARCLWTQNPDRVLFFRAHQPMRVLTRVAEGVVEGSADQTRTE